MPEPVFRSDMTVDLVNSMAHDAMVVRAARVSTGNDLILSNDNGPGLISYLMRNRHGTPFEHNSFTFRIECPIFVAREFMRHRIASYNEASGRYKEMKGVFWIPAPARPLVQEGKPSHYVMKPGTIYQYDYAVDSLMQTADFCYARYEDMLKAGICREVARAALSVAVYTYFYVTINARGLMNFLSLRVDDPDALFPSKPQYEIEQAALQMEAEFQKKMPVTYKAFVDNRRVAP
jgi:thymidylate synthase (FAD)